MPCPGPGMAVAGCPQANGGLPTGLQVSPQEAERQGVFDGRQWPVYVRLTNGKVYGADLVISAIGVLPNTSWMEPGVALDPETSGIVVNRCWPAGFPAFAGPGPSAWVQRVHVWQSELPHESRRQCLVLASATGVGVARVDRHPRHARVAVGD